MCSLLLTTSTRTRTTKTTDETRQRWCRVAEVVARTAPDKEKPQVIHLVTWGFVCALGGIRTPNLLIRSQMLYPLSYERWTTSSNDTWEGASEANRLPGRLEGVRRTAGRRGGRGGGILATVGDLG